MKYFSYRFMLMISVVFLVSSCNHSSKIMNTKNWVNIDQTYTTKSNDIRYKYRGDYDAIWNYSEWLARVTKNWLYWFIDESWTLVIPIIYRDAWSFSEWLAAVNTWWKYFFINKKWEKVFWDFDYLRKFSEWFSIFNTKPYWADNMKCWYINPEWIQTPWEIFDECFPFSWWIAYARKIWEWYVSLFKDWKNSIKTNGSRWWKTKEATAKEQDGMLRQKIGDDIRFWEFQDNKALWISNFNTYQAAGDYSSWIAPVLKDGVIVFIKKDGEVILNKWYKKIQHNLEYLGFYEWKMPVKYGSWISYIGKDGEILFSIKDAEDGQDFWNWYAWIQIKWKWWCINVDGEIKIEPQYDYISWCWDKLIKVRNNKKEWYINHDGKAIIKVTYDKIWEFHDNIVRAEHAGNIEYLNSSWEKITNIVFKDTATDFSDWIAQSFLTNTNDPFSPTPIYIYPDGFTTSKNANWN